MDSATTMRPKMAAHQCLKWRSSVTIVILFIISSRINQVQMASAIREARNSPAQGRADKASSFYTIDRFDYENEHDNERKPVLDAPHSYQAHSRISKSPIDHSSARFANPSGMRNLLPLNVTRNKQNHPNQGSQMNLNDTLARLGEPLRESFELQSKRSNKRKKLKLNSSGKKGESTERSDAMSDLIEVLDIASRRLLEQQRRLAESDIEVGLPKRGSERNGSRVHDDYVDDGDKYLGPIKPVDLYQQHAAASNMEQSRENVHQGPTTVKPQAKKSKNRDKSKKKLKTKSAFKSVETRRTGISQEAPVGNGTTATHAADHDLVKAGFQADDSIIGDGSDPLMGRYTQRQYSPNQALEPNGAELALVAARKRSEQLIGHPSIAAHKPIVAKDLLHINGQSQPRSQDSRYFMKQAGGGAEDASGVHSHHPLSIPDRHQPQMMAFHESGEPNEANQLAGPLYESRLPYSGPRYPSSDSPQPMLSNHLEGPYEQLLRRLSAQPAEPHGLSGGALKPPLEQSHRPMHKRPDWTPLVEPGSGDPSHPLARPRFSGVVYGHPYDTSPPQQQLLNPLLLGLNNGGPSGAEGPANELNNRLGEHTQQHAGLVNPLQHLLMAAKSQQAAALDNERRRLDYELALRNREQQMRAHHEDNLERQRHAAQQHQAELARKQQQQQQQQRLQHTQTTPDEQAGNSEQNDNSNQQQGEGENQERGEQSGQEQESDQNDPQANSGKDDPEMKNFQSFAGVDTDFTDLFPPGILSEAEIKEMRKQQEDQKRHEEQEERERQQQQQQQADEQQGEQEAAGGEQENTNQAEQQQVNSSQTAEPQAPASEEPKATVGQTVSFESANSAAKGVGGKTNATQSRANDRQQTEGAKENLPGFLFANSSAKHLGLEQASTNRTKVRRSNSPPAPLLVLDSEFQERYMKSFSSLQADRVASPTETPANRLVERNWPAHSHDMEQERDFHETGASHKLPGPLIDFDDFIGDFESSLRHRR